MVAQVPQDVLSLRDQEIVADLLGYWNPVENDGKTCWNPEEYDGKSFFPGGAFRPSKSESGRPFTREHLFFFPQHGNDFTKEQLMEFMTKMGFKNVALLPPTLPDHVPLSEQERLKSLKEPFGFIGAEKPL